MKTVIITTLMMLFIGCSYNNKNTSIKRSPERIAYEQCKQKNFGDISKCSKEKKDLLERQEIELMDEGS